MIFNVSVIKSLMRLKGLLLSGILTLLLFTNLSFGQTAEAEANFVVCKACHTIGGGKLVGPDLQGVTERYDEAWLIKFIQNSQELINSGDSIAVKVFEENNKIPMPPNNLTDDQVRDILLYIENGGKVAESEVGETKQEVAEAVVEEEESTELLAEMKREDARHLQATFIAMVVLMLLALFDLLVTKIIKQKWIPIVILIIAVIISGEVIFIEATNLGRQQYYQPEQPVWFSHKVHAGQNQIDCKYCHFTADKSMHSGIPPVAVCMNCHNQVKKGKVTGEIEIAKVIEAYNNGEPIEWVKVHNLPDHVYFNHSQHVNVGKMDCTECHGDVAKMDEIIQVNDLSMGWCIDCHRTKEVNFANKFYDQYKQLHEEIAKGEKSKVLVTDVGGEDCQKCHY
ncbi:MAG: c-type cytochrome [Bacteroidales bacterium]|jgi:cytochrome c551/c552|nr:c-type cytochrome [Bacteroidales bacterium]